MRRRLPGALAIVLLTLMMGGCATKGEVREIRQYLVDLHGWLESIPATLNPVGDPDVTQPSKPPPTWP